MKTAIITLILASLLPAAEPLRSPTGYASDATIAIETPIGIWPLCLVGIQMPGCYAGMPQTWVRFVYLLLPDGSAGALVSEEAISR